MSIFTSPRYLLFQRVSRWFYLFLGIASIYRIQEQWRSTDDKTMKVWFAVFAVFMGCVTWWTWRCDGEYEVWLEGEVERERVRRGDVGRVEGMEKGEGERVEQDGRIEEGDKSIGEKIEGVGEEG
jgi:hypothetical protein